MLITPTASSQIFAGAGLWSVIWSIIYKIESLAKMVGLGSFVSREKILNWINDHKAFTIIATELINLGWHGTESGNSMLFNMGGTFVNIIMIFPVGMTRAVLRRRRFARFEI